MTELNGRNEQYVPRGTVPRLPLTHRSSSTSSTLAQLSATLDSLEVAFNAYSPPSDLQGSAPLSRIQSRASTASKRQTVPAPSSQAPTPATAASPAATPPSAPEIRQRRTRTGPSLSAYLSKREKEDKQGGEAGLIAVAQPIQQDGAGKEGIDAEKQREEEDSRRSKLV